MLNFLKGLFGGGGGRDAVFWAWGPGVFDNDDAADWVWILQEEGAGAVDAALERALEGARNGSISLEAGHQCLAAGEAVAQALGRGADGLDEEQVQAMDTHAEAVRALPEIRERAVRAVIAVLGQSPEGKPVASQLALKWENSGSDAEFAKFMAAVEDLAVRLKG